MKNLSIKICELCGERNAKYICQECGRAVCEQCIEPYSWLCLDCYRKTKTEEKTPSSEMETYGRSLFQIPFMKIFFLGFLLIFAGMIILMLATIFFGLKDSFGLILLIGPIPIIFGTGQISLPLIILAITLTILCIIVFILLSRRKIDFRTFPIKSSRLFEIAS